MNSTRLAAAAGRKAPRIIMLALLAAGFAFRAAAQETADPEAPADEVLQYERIQNKIKPASSVMTIDLPFTFNDPFTDEEISEDMKSLISIARRCQADRGTTNHDRISLVCSYALFSQEYAKNYLVGNEEAAMQSLMVNSMVSRMKEMEESGQIGAFSHRIMDLKLSNSKDKALLLKGSYREGVKDFEVWMLQVLHKREVWQLIFFFNPENVAMQDAVEAACFSASVK